MCIAFKQQGKTFKPGQTVAVQSPQGPLVRPWAAYARSERMEYWVKQRSAIAVEILADGFAERHRQTNQIIWENIPSGRIIQALLAKPKDPDTFLIPPDPECYIVTRAATANEANHFGHDRLPMIAPASL